MRRYQQAVERARNDQFRRLVLAAVAGVMLAHLLAMDASTVFIGLYPASILLGMPRLSLSGLLLRCVVLLGGMTVGTLVMEFLLNHPLPAALITYAVFLGILKLFARRFETANAHSFMFAYSLSTIYASYPNSTMELSILQAYFIQTVLIFFLVWGCFALFPAQLPAKRQPVPSPAAVADGVLALYALIWLGIWLFFQLFEWRFALFAFLSFTGAFRSFDRAAMKQVARENVLAHVFCCTLVALFSLLLLGLAGNGFVLLTGVTVLVLPFMYFAVYPPRPELGYRCGAMIPGLLVPLILYVSPDRAAVDQSLLRASLIVFLMFLLYLAVEYFYHGINAVKAISNRLRRPLPNKTEEACTNRI